MRKTIDLIRLFFWQAKIRILRSMEYRADFYMGMVVSLVFSGLGPVFQYLIFTNTKGYPGWSFEEILLFQGVLLLWLGVKDTLFGEVRNLMNATVLKGEFDRLLLKPYPAIGVLLASGFNYYGIGAVIAGATISVYALAHLGTSIGIGQIVLFLLFIVFGILLYIAVTILYCVIILIVVSPGRVSEIINKLIKFAEFPLDIFPKMLQITLVTVLPFAVWVYYPAQALLNRLSAISYLSGIFSVVLVLLSLKFWKSQLNKYTSAGG